MEVAAARNDECTQEEEEEEGTKKERNLGMHARTQNPDWGEKDCLFGPGRNTKRVCQLGRI